MYSINKASCPDHVESRMRGNAHVRFGGRGQEDLPAKAGKASCPRPYTSVGTATSRSWSVTTAAGWCGPRRAGTRIPCEASSTSSVRSEAPRSPTYRPIRPTGSLRWSRNAARMRCFAPTRITWSPGPPRRLTRSAGRLGTRPAGRSTGAPPDGRQAWPAPSSTPATRCGRTLRTSPSASARSWPGSPRPTPACTGHTSSRKA